MLCGYGDSETACLLAALSLHGLLPCGFSRDDWNWAVGRWWLLGGTQRNGLRHRLYRIPAGQLSVPVVKECPVLGGRVAAHNREGLAVSAAILNAAVCLDETASSDVWVSDDSGCPYVAMRRTVAVECTGLGGADLHSPNPWGLLVRTGCHHEEVYVPSLARLEDARVVNQCNVQYVGLGLTKASHEFLMLHYFATDSSQIWDDLDSLAEIVFPHAPSRRAHAYHAFLAAHIAPSYRRLAHPLWSSCMSLILRL